MSNFIRLVSAFVLVVAVSLIAANAQREQPQPEREKPDVQDDGKLIFKSGTDDVPLAELITLYAQDAKRIVIYDPKRVVGTVTYLAPDDGANTTLEAALRAALSEFRLSLVSVGDFDLIVPTAEVITYAPTVTLQELESVPAGRTVRVVVHLKTLDAAAARSTLMNLVSRQGGYISPMNNMTTSTTNAVVLCDTAENVRSLVKLLAEADSESSIKTQVVTLKHAKAFDLVRQIQSASGKTVSVGMTEESPYVALTGSDADVKRVAALIAALDVQKD